MPPKKRKGQPLRKAPAVATPRKSKVPNPQTGECTICFENYDHNYGELKCKHVFCFKCIKNWSEKENTCPLCKSRFSYIHHIEKDSKTNDFLKKKVNIRAKSQTQSSPVTASVNAGFFFAHIAHMAHHLLQDDYDDDDDEDYVDHFFEDLDDDDDDEYDLDETRYEIDQSNIWGHGPNLFSELFRGYINRMNGNYAGSIENPISLVDADEIDQVSASRTEQSRNSSSNSQPIVIDLTDDQVQSDIRDISNTEENTSSSSNVPIIPSAPLQDSSLQPMAGVKRRRQFTAVEEIDNGDLLRRTRSAISLTTTDSSTPPSRKRKSRAEAIESFEL